MISREQITQKIDYVISCADQFNDEQFQQVLVGLIKKGGKDAEYILVQYITASDIPYETRANIIYSAGDIKNVMYLLPLKKVIDEEPNIKLKKAAILALAGYNNERALNILQGTLDTVTNPILKKTIQEKINLIRQKHPVLALTPRFLKGSKDIKAHQVSLGILKKTLNPDEASSFLKHKDSEDPLIRKGVFEILCSAADASVRESVIKLFLQRADSLDCVDQPKCDDLYILTGNLKHYLERFPSAMDAQCIHMKSLFAAVVDIRVKNIIIAIFCRCQNPDAFVFMKEIYDQQPDFREAIIEESAGNAQAVTFLFKQYQSGQTLKEKVIGSLLHSTQGLNYFLKNFPKFDEQHQEMVVRNLPYSDNPVLTEFIESILKSGAPNLKKYILDTVRKNHLHHFKHLLFDPGKDDEFFSMEQEYLDTIFEVFPTSAAKKLMIRIAEGELDLGTMKRYMKLVDEAAQSELIVNFSGNGGDNQILKLTTRIINFNNMELTNIFLSILAQLKTFDFQTYKYLSDSLNHFTKVKSKDDKMLEAERVGVKRVRENLKIVLDEIRKIESIEKDIKVLLTKTVPDVLQLKRVVGSNGVAIAFKVKPLINLMMDFFKSVDDAVIAKWRAFFKEFPLITQMVREARLRDSQAQQQSTASVQDKLRIVLNFEEREITALFKDQFNEILPDIKIAVDETELQSLDVLMCDSDTLRNEYIKKKKLATRRLFILFKNRDEFHHFKDYNPKSFLRPISAYRTIKLILQEFYLPKQI